MHREDQQVVRVRLGQLVLQEHQASQVRPVQRVDLQDLLEILDLPEALLAQRVRPEMPPLGRLEILEGPGSSVKPAQLDLPPFSHILEALTSSQAYLDRVLAQRVFTLPFSAGLS